MENKHPLNTFLKLKFVHKIENVYEISRKNDSSPNKTVLPEKYISYYQLWINCKMLSRTSQNINKTVPKQTRSNLCHKRVNIAVNQKKLH